MTTLAYQESREQVLERLKSDAGGCRARAIPSVSSKVDAGINLEALFSFFLHFYA